MRLRGDTAGTGAGRRVGLTVRPGPARLVSRRVAAAVVLLACVLTPTVAFAPPASAHAALLDSDPPDGSRLAAAPTAVTLRFSEEVRPGVGVTRVVDSHGARVDGGPAHTVGDGSTQVVVPLRAGLGDSGYLVSYQVLSADSHPVNGAIAFAVGSAPLLDVSGSVADGAGTDGRLGTTLVVVRWLSYAGLVLLGGAVFVSLCWPAGGTDAGVRRILGTGGALVAAGAVGTLVLYGPYVTGRGPSALLDPGMLQATLALPIGKVLLLRLGALAVLGWLLSRALPAKARGAPRSGAEDAAALVGFMLLFSFAAIGHVASDPLPLVALLADIAHLAAMSIWLGGLVTVATRVLRTAPALATTTSLPRFSRLALSCVVVLVATGTYRALVAVGSPGAVLGTGYGRLLLLKVALVAVILATAGVSRRLVHRSGSGPASPSPAPGAVAAPAGLAPLPDGDGRRPAAQDRSPVDPAVGDPAPLGRLRRLVLCELAVALAVLAVTAVLVGRPQARTVHSGQVTASVQLERLGTGELTLSPGRAGSNTMRLRLTDAAGRPLDPLEVELTARLPGERSGPLRIPVDELDRGSYRAEAVTLPRAGRWELTLRVRTGQFDSVAARATVAVR